MRLPIVLTDGVGENFEVVLDEVLVNENKAFDGRVRLGMDFWAGNGREVVWMGMGCTEGFEGLIFGGRKVPFQTRIE